MPEFDFDSLNDVKKEEKATLKPSEIKEAIKKNAEKKPFEAKKKIIGSLTSEDAIKFLVEKSELSKEEIDEMINNKMNDLKGLLSYEGAIFIVGKELGIDIPTPNKQKKVEKDAFESVPIAQETKIEAYSEASVIPLKKPEKPQPKITKHTTIEKEPEYAIQIVKDYENIPNITEYKHLPSQDVITESISMYRYLMKSIIKPSDFQPIGDGEFMKKSGFRKIAQAFGISIEQIGKEEIFERNNDTYARVKVKASLGTLNYEKGLQILVEGKHLTIDEAMEILTKLCKVRYAEGIGIIGMLEIKFAKGRTLHNLITTAYTRAANRAIADLVGFGVVSATEVDGNADNKEWDVKPEKDAFGGE